jgi:hypothetical protein
MLDLRPAPSATPASPRPGPVPRRRLYGEAMADLVWPLEPDEVPEWKSRNSIGSHLMRNTRPDAQGRFFATEWCTWMLPIFPTKLLGAPRRNDLRLVGRDHPLRGFRAVEDPPGGNAEDLLVPLGLLPVILVPWHSRRAQPWGFADVPDDWGPHPVLDVPSGSVLDRLGPVRALSATGSRGRAGDGRTAVRAEVRRPRRQHVVVKWPSHASVKEECHARLWFEERERLAVPL